MRRLLFLALIPLVVTLPAVGVRAESPSDVVEQADGGVFVAPGIDGYDEAALAEVVASGRRVGLAMMVVAPADPKPTVQAFALRVRQAAEADVVLVFSGDGGIQASVTDEYVNREVPALEAARLAPSPESAASAYLEALMAERDDSLPGTVRRVVTIVMVLLVLLVGATVAEQYLNRGPSPAAQPESQDTSA